VYVYDFLIIIFYINKFESLNDILDFCE